MFENMNDVKQKCPTDSFVPDCSVISKSGIPLESSNPTKLRICHSSKGPACVYSAWIEKRNDYVNYGFRCCLYSFRKNI